MTILTVSETRFPSAGPTLLAGLLATASIMAVGSVVGIGAKALLTNLWRNLNALLGWLVLLVNLISHGTAIVLAVILMKRVSGRRAELLRLTIMLMVGYAVIVFLSTLFQQIGTPALVALSSATQSSFRLLSFIIWFAVPSAIAFAILAFAGDADRATRS